MRKWWSVLLVFALVVASFQCYAMELGLESKKSLLENADDLSCNLPEDGLSLTEEVLERMQKTFAEEGQPLDNETVEMTYNEYLKKLETLERKSEGEVKSIDTSEERIQLFSSTYAVSTYSYTTIPTYTYVTGRRLYDVYYEEQNALYIYLYNIDEYFDYLDYLIDYCGWMFVTESVTDDEKNAYIYLEKEDGSWLQLGVNFELGVVTILYIAPTSLSLDIGARVMVVGNQYTLWPTVEPATVTDKKITWTSSNSSVASVSEEGVVIAKKAGSTTITAKTLNGKKATCSVTVKNLVLDYYTDTIIPTYSCITAKSLLNYAEDGNIVWYDYLFDYESHTDYEAYLVNKDGWTFFDEEIAEDASYYMAYYVKNDTLLIVVADFENNVTSIAYAKPEILATRVSLNTTGRTMIVGNQYTLNATIYPADTTDKTIAWRSSNSNVASVSADGVVTAKAAGTATITAETSNGKTASCTVLVKKLMLEYYGEESIPTFTCVTGKILVKYKEENGMRVYEYPLDIESHTDYEAYLVSKDGWLMATDETADGQSYYSATYKKDDTSVIVVADFENNVSRVMFADSRILTKTIREGNEFTVIATEVPAGSKVIFACYDREIMTDVQSCVYRGEEYLTFTTNQSYDNAKIFVWENTDAMTAVAPPETITQ